MKKILLFFLLCSISILAKSQYCYPLFESSDNDYINHFQLNSIVNLFSETNSSGNTTYLPTEFTTYLTIGSSYFMQMGEEYNSGPGGRFSAWIDYNNDSTFSTNELVYNSGNGVCYASTYITIPNDSSLIGLKRMRVMHALYWGDISPCGSYNDGESEDYYIHITDSIVNPEYCTPIDNWEGNGFLIENFKLNTIHNCSSGTNNLNYTIYPDTVFTTDLEIGKTYDIYISYGSNMGISGGFKVFIDYNNNNVFNANELVYAASNISIASGYITIPNDSSLIGKHRMRVRSQFSGVPLDACYWVTDGETEDYFVNIVPAIIDTNTIPTNLWERTYNLSGNQIGTSILETYDKGFIITSAKGANSSIIYLIKTSIDGDTLWTKTFNSSYFYQPFSLDTTKDGGFILCGMTTETDASGAGFVMKLDACGDKQWTKYFGISGNYDLLTEIYQLPDSSYITSGWYLGPTGTATQGRIGLIKIDKNGNTIWYNDYTHFNNSNSKSFIKTKDNGFLISGYGYTPIPGDTSGNYWLRSILTKIDSLGQIEWNTALGEANNTISQAISTTEIPNQGYITLCSVYDTLTQIYRMSVFKTDFNGIIYWVKPLTPDTFYHYNGCFIKPVNNNLYAIAANRYDDCDIYTYRMSVFVIDSLGNVLSTKTFGKVNSQIGNINITSNNKIIVTGTKVITNNYDIYAIKLNIDLSFDTLYNSNINYDSICDSINSIYEIEAIQSNIQVSVIPNPCDNFTFFNINNLNNHTYNVSIFNINGILEKYYPDCKNDKLLIDFSSKNPGIYIAKIKFDNNIILIKKIIVFSKH